VPYIKPELREDLDPTEYAIIACDSGELNYQITMICNAYLEENGKTYKRINDIVGALECAKLELYRLVAVPYENLKMAENGEVYTV